MDNYLIEENIVLSTLTVVVLVFNTIANRRKVVNIEVDNIEMLRMFVPPEATIFTFCTLLSFTMHNFTYRIRLPIFSLHPVWGGCRWPGEFFKTVGVFHLLSERKVKH